ncbi:hypothetical protein THAOC_15012 [Thalassiosira oceanica]|uniref:Uncharacterized protein n=1 Tax=Thalassiosira oceanica TaxID=159749 RepID=K0SDW2_THAOC|nr:hypothetical protein THAOC_15012 [Thalassiosira oceanica]|eukprot:EJK64268.1 hypothetical protein THAOC_15012 [Thalassiosira oceanica]
MRRTKIADDPMILPPRRKQTRKQIDKGSRVHRMNGIYANKWLERKWRKVRPREVRSDTMFTGNKTMFDTITMSLRGL